MTPMLDLMPRSCREALGHRASVRRWVGAYTIGLSSLLVAWWLVGVGWSSDETTRNELGTQVEQMYARNQEIQSLLLDLQRLEESITRHNRLAWPIKVSNAIDTMGWLTPAGVTLNVLGLAPREQRGGHAPHPTPNAKGKEAAPAAEPTTVLVLEAEGVATSDAEVARFVAGLESSPLFVRVGLDYTRSAESLTSVARAFRLTCEIDLGRSYTFVEEDHGTSEEAPQ